LGHAAGAPAVHAPLPSHALIVRVDPGLGQEVAHCVPFATNEQAPVAVQSVAPHAPPIGLQVAVQQRVPVPLVPQMPFVHWSFAPHVAPATPLPTHVPDAPGVAQ
jgi:hypothetical protein